MSDNNYVQTFPDNLPDEVASWILDTASDVRLGSDILKVAMDLPPIGRISIVTLADAIVKTLKEFRIEIPTEYYERIKRGEQEIVFLPPASEKHIRPRTVIINSASEVSTMLIRGEAPIDGVNGSVSLFFDYQKKPGRVLQNGAIDFREINRFPQAKDGEHLVRLYMPTAGIQGTDVPGWPISAEPGKPYILEIGDGISVKRGLEKEPNRQFKDLFATKRGIIKCEFEGSARDPSKLRKIAVQNHIVMMDVDFGTGNLSGQYGEIRCAADVVVQGDILGCFSLIIQGTLEVRGAIEGEAVDASGPVTASFVRSSVRSGKFIKVGAARSARLNAEESVTINREIVQCMVKTDLLLVEPRNTPEVMCGNVTISAHRVMMKRVNIRNLVKIDLGADLFSQLAQLKEREEMLLKEEDSDIIEVKDRVAVLGNKLKIARTTLGPDHRKSLQAVRTLVPMILKESVEPKEMRGKIHDILKTYGPELKGLTQQVKHILLVQERRKERQEEVKGIATQKESVEESMSRLNVKIKGVISASAQLVIRCGPEERCWQTQPEKNIETIDVMLVYILDDGLVEIG